MSLLTKFSFDYFLGDRFSLSVNKSNITIKFQCYSKVDLFVRIFILVLFSLSFSLFYYRFYMYETLLFLFFFILIRRQIDDLMFQTIKKKHKLISSLSVEFSEQLFAMNHFVYLYAYHYSNLRLNKVSEDSK